MNSMDYEFETGVIRYCSGIIGQIMSYTQNVRVLDMLRSWLRQQRHPHLWYAGLICVAALVIFGSFEHLFGGNAEWGAVEGGRFFLGNRIGPHIEVSAIAYWLSICALWLLRLACAWLVGVCLFYKFRKNVRSQSPPS